MNSKFESGIKQVPYAQQQVFDMLSDLNNVERAKRLVPEEKLNDLEHTGDSVSMNIPMVGKVSLRVVEREEPKCVKYESVSSPLPFTLWAQMLPTGDNSSKLRLTLQADLNPFVRTMVSKQLQEGVEKLADALASIHYE